MQPLIATITLLWGGFWVMAFFASLERRPFEPMQDISLLFFLGIAPLLYSAYLFRRMHKQKKNQDLGAMQRTILKLARSKKGLLAVVDVAEQTSLSLEEAQVLLDEMVVKGYADCQVGVEGAVLYKFFFN